MKYKRHPKYRDVFISENGKEVIVDNTLRTISKREPKKGYPLMCVNFYNSEFSLAKLVLETYGDKPADRNYYFAKCIDGNIENTHPNNLKWVRRTCRELTENEVLKRACTLSRIPTDELSNIYVGYTKFNITLSYYARVFKTSRTTIARVIKRYKRMTKLKLI